MSVTFALCAEAQTPDFDLNGFAALEGTGNFYKAGGTTGGEGGKIVHPTTFTELKAYLESANPYIVLVDSEINTGFPCFVNEDGVLAESGIETTYGERILVASNKTLLGISDKAQLSRISLVMNSTDEANGYGNIIIRNLKITMSNVPVSREDENKIVALRDGVETLVGDPDCIGIQADKNSASTDFGHHIWVDHCEFFNAPASYKDRYDGLLDMKNNVRYITISWCHFHGADKACLSGKGNSDNFDRLVTMHHNYFQSIEGSRLPLQRFGYYHYYNNYMKDCEDGYNLRINSNSYIENCYFESTKLPIFGKASENGKGTLINVLFKDCRNLPVGYTNIDGTKYEPLDSDDYFETSDFNPYTDYDNYVAVVDSTELLPTLVPAYSGVGKITDAYDVNEAVDDLDNTGTVVDTDLGVGEAWLAVKEGTDYSYYWMNNDHATHIDSLITAGEIVLNNSPTSETSSSFRPDYCPTSSSDATLTSPYTGSLELAKASENGTEGGSVIFKLPSCGLFKAYMYRTGSFYYQVDASTDNGVTWKNVTSVSKGTKGAAEVNWSSLLKSATPLYVKITNQSTGGLNIQGVAICVADTTGTPVVPDTNEAPVITSIEPQDGATFSEEDSITLQASATDADGSIATLRLYIDNILVCEVSDNDLISFPTRFSAGSYTIKVNAVDDEGKNATKTVKISVTSVVTPGEEGDSLWIQAGTLPAGYAVDGTTSFSAYSYSSNIVTGANLILFAAGQHTVTLPEGVTVKGIVIQGCADNNEDGKGAITEVAGTSCSGTALPNRKTSASLGMFVFSGLNISSSFTFTNTYKAGLKLCLILDDATSIEVTQRAVIPVSVSYYNLTGQRFSTPQKGVNLVQKKYTDGSVTVQKVLVK